MWASKMLPSSTAYSEQMLNIIFGAAVWRYSSFYVEISQSRNKKINIRFADFNRQISY